MSNQYINDFNETVKIYYNDLKKYQPLTKKRERKLIRLAKKGNLEAKNELIESNLKFVFNIAKKYTGRGIPISDLISDGNVGLMKAINKFDESKNVKFISYAVWWIKQAMQESINKRKKLNNSEINPIESNNVVIERTITDEEDETVSFYEASFSNEVEENNKEVMKNQKRFISDIFKTLTKREKEVIESFYGLNGNEELSLTEISQKCKLSIERVRQIKLGALRKLRTNTMLSTEKFNELF
jgi:RNA polymerase primary sigma factor